MQTTDYTEWTPNTESIYNLYKDWEETPDAFITKKERSFHGMVDTGTSISFGDWTLTNHYREGGYEGCGEEHYIILKLEKKGVLHSWWRVPGWYQSYNGSELEWENAHQVEPYEKTVTDYRSI
jgi:hypothetical protein